MLDAIKNNLTNGAYDNKPEYIEIDIQRVKDKLDAALDLIGDVCQRLDSLEDDLKEAKMENAISDTRKAWLDASLAYDYIEEV